MAMIERLEARQFLDAAGAAEGVPAGAAAEPAVVADVVRPTLRGVHVLGPWQAATGLVLHFSEPLDPAAATNVSAYRVWGTQRVKSFDRDQRKLPLGRADYDEASATVTLVPAQPSFNVRRLLREVYVHPTVTDVAGNPLAGDRSPLGSDLGLLDGYVPFLFRPPRTKRAFAYFDRDGSQVRLRLRGPGRATLLLRAEGARTKREMWGPSPVKTWGEGMQLFIDGATPQTVLTGTVTTGLPGSDAATSLLEIVNPAGAQIALLNDPAFSIASVRT